MIVRAIVFGFLGPVLSGWLLVIASFLLNGGRVERVLVIPYVILEICLLLLCAVADLLLEALPFRERAFVLAVIGALLPGVAIHEFAPKAFQDHALVFALCGALPAVICSLIVERLPRREQA